MQLLPSIIAIVLVILIIGGNPVDSQPKCSSRSIGSGSGSGSGLESRSNCGDGDLDLGEECDDNNTISNDGCSANCMVEPGYECCTNGSNVLSYCRVIGCGDGEIALSVEECDDGNTASGDGCSSNCTIEKGFNCSTNDQYQSICNFVYLLDLDYRDKLSSLNYPDVIVYETPLFLLNISLIDFVLINNSLWDSISVVIMRNPNGNNGESVEVAVLQAVQDNRLENTSDLYNAFVNEELDPDRQDALENILGEKIYQGERYKRKSDAVDPSLFVKVVLASLRYNYDDETDFVPRNICVVAQSGPYNSVGCINVTFVGENDNPPKLSYTPAATLPMFIEEQLTPVPILNGTLTITDRDHPMYLMQSATVVLFAVDVVHETLSLDNETFPLITSEYDPDNGRLTITGNATTNVYEEIFKNVVYFNSNDEPDQLSMRREFQLTLFDGEQSGIRNGISLVLVNLNDVPTILFSGNNLMFYYEGNGSVIVDSDIYVLDPDPDEMIQSLTIYLLYAVDGNNEEITIYNPGSIPTITRDSHKLELTGKDTPLNYTATLKTLRYEHKDSYPGNPTAGNRTLMFVVEDDTSKNKTLYFTFYVQPINDAPTLRFNNMSGATSKSLSYFEDDPLLLFAKDLYLRDVDSDISTATVHFVGLLNGNNDYFTINETLAAYYGISIDITDGINSRSIIATGNSSSEHYREVLRTLGYVNLLTNNSVTDGVRTVILLVNDTKGYDSETVTISIAVSERNDQPSVTIDEIIQFTEGSKSVDIVTLHLLDIIDEEMNNISSINITLTATNGDLDEEDIIFIRTPFYPLITYADVTNRSVYISFEGTVEQFEEVLKSIRYVNQEDEPTYYVNVTSKEKLERVIIVQIIDNNATHPSLAEHHIMINMTLVNDNAPVIKLNLTNSSCLTSYPGVVNNLQRRDVQSFGTRLKRRLHLKRKTNDVLGLAPSVLTAYSQYSFLTENITCLSNIIIVFNANTTTPVVEVKPDLQDLLTLYPSDISSMPHYGRWMNKETLSIQFMGCYIWPTTSANAMSVLFNSQQDECNVTTPCLSGICFLNKTGCPLIGLHSIKTNTTFSFNVTTESPPTQASRHGGLISSYIILALIVTVSLAVLVVSVKVLSSDKKLQNKDQKFLKSEKLIQELLKTPETLKSKDNTSLTLQMSNSKNETTTNTPLQILENPSAVKTSGNASTTTDDICQSSSSDDLSISNNTNLALTAQCKHLPSPQSSNQSSQLQRSVTSCQSLTTSTRKENLTSSDKRLVESRGSHSNV